MFETPSAANTAIRATLAKARADGGICKDRRLTMENENPIEASKKWLVECGYTEAEAENLLRAIHHEDPEKLWELVPKWIEHVGEHKKYQHALLDLVAHGLFSVTANETGEWCFSLNDKGMEVGRQIGLKP